MVSTISIIVGVIWSINMVSTISIIVGDVHVNRKLQFLKINEKAPSFYGGIKSGIKLLSPIMDFCS
jgi:hypothetical protein